MLCDHLILCVASHGKRKGGRQRGASRQRGAASTSLHEQLLFSFYYFNIAIINEHPNVFVWIQGTYTKGCVAGDLFLVLIFIFGSFFFLPGCFAADCRSLTALLWGNWKCFTGKFCHLAYNCNMVLLSIFNQYLTFSINNLSVLSQKEES